MTARISLKRHFGYNPPLCYKQNGHKGVYLSTSYEYEKSRIIYNRFAGINCLHNCLLSGNWEGYF